MNRGLHTIVYDTRRATYCGTVAICAVTGLSAAVVIAAIEDYRGDEAYRSDGHRKGVRGMWLPELHAVLENLGYRATLRTLPKPWPTMAAYCQGLAERPGVARVAHIRGHYMAVSGDGSEVCDTKTKQPKSARLGPYRRARVRDEFLIYGA